MRSVHGRRSCRPAAAFEALTISYLALASTLGTAQVSGVEETVGLMGGGGFGVDVSYPVQHWSVSRDGPLGNKQEFYDHLLNGCRVRYGDQCDLSELDRIKLNAAQPASVVNFTDTGYKKVRFPEHTFNLLKEFWERNKDRQELELWGGGDMTCNFWEAEQYMVSLENRGLRGDGYAIKEKVWKAAERILQEWTGQDLRACSLYGIRVYRDGSILSPHVDRFPLVSSAIVNVAQDVDEPWPLEVYGRDGRAVNITMEAGDMILYESHSLIHGRPFPLRGKYMANVFIHFEPKAIGQNGLPVYLKPDADESVIQTWKVQVSENAGEGLEEREPIDRDEEDFEDEDYFDSTEAHSAAAKGDLEALRRIASNSADDLHVADSNGWKPIHEAARGGHTDVVLLLLEHGADINERTFLGKGETPLRLTLLEHGQEHPLVRTFESLGALDIGPEL